MTFTVVSVTFFIGLGLVVVAIVGGGIEVKEVKVAALSGLSRVFCFAVGLVLLSLCMLRPDLLQGLSTADTGAAETKPTRSVAKIDDQKSSPATQARNVVFMDTIGDTQISEDVDVFVDGEQIGKFRLDRNSPTALIRYATKNSRIRYYLKGKTVYKGDSVDDTESYELTGRGLLEVDDGDRFAMSASKATKTYSLEKD